MAASGYQANWSGCTFGVTPITEIQSCSIDTGGSLTPVSSGVDRYPTNHANLMSQPSVSLSTSDVAGAMGLTGKNTLTITLKDAFLQTGGDIVFVCANATVERSSGSGNHGSLATGQLNFKLSATDGITSPISFTRA